MKPDSFKSQTSSCKQSWQPTSITRTSRGFRAPAVAPRSRLSSADSKTKRTLEQRPRTRQASRTRAAAPQRRPRRGPRGSGCSPVDWEEPAAAPVVAESVGSISPQPSQKGWGEGW